MSEISDWIWLAVAAFWIIARVLPRLFRKQGAPAVSQPKPRPGPQTGPTARYPDAGRRAGASTKPSGQFGGQPVDRQTSRRIRSAEPIEPR